MARKLLLIMLLIWTLTFAFSIKQTKATPDDLWVPYDYGTIQEAINAADPGDHIHVTGTYHEHIVVNKTLTLTGEGEAIIDGDETGTVVNITASSVTITNFKIFNAGPDWGTRDSGITLLGRSNCFIINNWINNSRLGIYARDSSHIRITENTITHSIEGVRIVYSPDNTILANHFQNNDVSVFLDGFNSRFNLVKANNMIDGNQGIHLQYWASNNTVINNWVINNEYGIMLSQSQNNTIYHNNFIENTNQAWIGSSSYYNKWGIEWPDGGNHWSNHNLEDKHSGQYQSEPESDGICDNPYTVYDSDIDKYPLAAPINLFEVPLGFITEEVNIISNSTISHFQMNTTEKIMKFNVTGDTGLGFCRVDIPNTIVSAAWEYNYTVKVNENPPIHIKNWTHATTTYIYFTYEHSEYEVTIIPELPLTLILSLFMIVTLLVVIGYRRKQPK